MLQSGKANFCPAKHDLPLPNYIEIKQLGYMDSLTEEKKKEELLFIVGYL